MNRPRLGGMSNVTGTEKPHRSQPRHPGEIAEGHGEGKPSHMPRWGVSAGEYSGVIFRRGWLGPSSGRVQRRDGSRWRFYHLDEDFASCPFPLVHSCRPWRIPFFVLKNSDMMIWYMIIFPHIEPWLRHTSMNIGQQSFPVIFFLKLKLKRLSVCGPAVVSWCSRPPENHKKTRPKNLRKKE